VAAVEMLRASASRPGAAPTTGSPYASSLVEPNTPEPMDGDDPRARGCYADAVVLETVVVHVPGSTKPLGGYGTMLATAGGCVWVEVTLAEPLHIPQPARTACLR
jgi:hypothetical protein